MTGAPRVAEAELHAFVDGQLGDERALAIAVWLAENPRDHARVEGWREQNEAIRRAFAPPEPPRPTIAFRAPETDERATGGPLRATSEALRETRPQRRTTPLLLAFAAGIVAALAATTSYRFALRAPAHQAGTIDVVAPLDDLARRSVQAWRAYAQDPARPVEIEVRNAPALAKWLNERVGLDRLPALPRARLLGGRVTPGPDGPAGLLLYATEKGETLALLIERGHGDSPPQDRTAGDLNVRVWARDGFDYALAGPVAPDRLRAFASVDGPR